MLLSKKTFAIVLTSTFMLFIVGTALLGFIDTAHASSDILSKVSCTGADCQLCNLFELINGVIGFLMFSVAAPLAAISFAIAGIKFFTSAGNPAKLQQAKSIFLYVFIGVIIALSAFIIIDTIMKSLLPDGETKFGPWNSVKCATALNIDGGLPSIDTGLV